MARTGRPRKYTEELAEELLRRISEGESLRGLARLPEFPSWRTLIDWTIGAKGALPAESDFPTRYVRARLARAEHCAEEMFEIADGAAEAATELADAAESTAVDMGADPKAARRVWNRTYSEEIQARKLRIDVRKWATARMDPNRWGDKVQHQLGLATPSPLTLPPPDLSMMSDEDRAQLRQLTARALQGPPTGARLAQLVEGRKTNGEPAASAAEAERKEAPGAGGGGGPSAMKGRGSLKSSLHADKNPPENSPAEGL